MDSSWEEDDDGRLTRVVIIEGVRHRQWDHANGPVLPISQQPTTNEHELAPRSCQDQNPANPSSYEQAANASNEQHFQHSHPSYFVTSRARQDSQRPPSDPTLHRHRGNTRETPQPTPYSLFPRESASSNTHDPPSQRSGSRSSIRSGSNESKDSERRALYRHREEGSTDRAIEYVTRPSYVSRQNTTLNHPGRASDSLTDKTRQGSNSLVSELAQHFVQIARRDYLGCEKFMIANPSIFNEDPNQLVQEAVRFAKDGKSAQARDCVQQSLLLRKCLRMTVNERRRFFALMAANDKKTLEDFLHDFDITINAVAALASTLGPTNPPLDKPMKPIHENKPLHIDERDQHRPTLENRQLRNSVPRRNSTDEQISAPFGGLAVTDRYGQESNDRSDQATMRPPLNRGPQEQNPTFSSDDTAVDNLSIVPDVRGSNDVNDQQENLDPKYYKRPDAKKFFVKGRVFALLWHQSAGEQKPRLDLSDAQYSFVGAYGERVFSHIQRMAVVRERYGYCICVPINTYHGQGVLKRGFTERDRHAHSIIYSSNTTPTSKAGEEGLIIKKSIAVNMANPGQRLDKMSRVHFGKAHTVEWNVKVMNVGKVAQASLANFMGYYQLESN